MCEIWCPTPRNGDADAPETHAPETNAVPKAAVAARTLPAKPAAVLAEAEPRSWADIFGGVLW